LQKLSELPVDKGVRPIRALIMVPTRELAAQVAESVQLYSAHLSIRHTVVFGGVNIKPQKSHLRAGVDILVATPGRLLDLMEQSAMTLNQVDFLVLDEADRMMDMGFMPAIKRILKMVPQERQTLLFSATFSKEILELADQILKDPVHIKVAADNSVADTVEQEVYFLPKAHKTTLLKHLIENNTWSQVLVFARTQHGAERLGKKLEKKKFSATTIHGGKSQPQRVKALSRFKEGKVQILVATDLAARGLDIKALPVVINYDIPNVSEDYVHRIGRAGRAGESGKAISLVGPEEELFFQRIEKLIKITMTRIKVPYLEDLPNIPVSETSQQNKPYKVVEKKVTRKNKQNVAPAPKKKKSSAKKAKERQKAKINPLSDKPKTS
jgi:ATP-dependent RNA helicase RhlE